MRIGQKPWQLCSLVVLFYENYSCIAILSPARFIDHVCQFALS